MKLSRRIISALTALSMFFMQPGTAVFAEVLNTEPADSPADTLTADDTDDPPPADNTLTEEETTDNEDDEEEDEENLADIAASLEDKIDYLQTAGVETIAVAMTEEEMDYYLSQNTEYLEYLDAVANSGVVSNAFDSYTHSTDYYYDQLNSAEKALYDNLTTVCENFLNSTATITDGLIPEYAECSGGSLTDNNALKVYNAFYYSNPQYFFLINGCSRIYYVGEENNIIAVVPAINADTMTTASSRDSYRSSINTITTSWMSDLNSISDPVAKEKYIAEHLCDLVTYTFNPSELQKEGHPDGRHNYDAYNDQTIAGALADKKCVCNGYALAAEYFLNAAGIECVTVTGCVHAWNRVKLYDNWYELDVTWMDSYEISGKYDYNWFNISSNKINNIGGYTNHHIPYSDAVNWRNLTLPSCIYDEVQMPSTGFDVEPIGDTNYVRITGISGLTGDDKVNIVIPETVKVDGVTKTVTDLAQTAFGTNNTVTKTISIPATVTVSIPPSAFDECKALTSITVDGNNKFFLSENGVLFNKDKTTLLRYPIARTGNGYTVPATVTKINDKAFMNCSYIEYAVLPDELQTIGSYAFFQCPMLETLVIPDSVNDISTAAFYKSPNLTVYANEGLYCYTYLTEHPSYQPGKGLKATPFAATNINIQKYPTKTTYYIGEDTEVDLKGGEIRVIRKDGVTKTYDMTKLAGLEVISADLSKKGTIPVTLGYGDCTVSFNVTGVENSIQTVKLGNFPKTSYYIDEEPNLENAYLQVKYQSGAEKDIPITKYMLTNWDTSTPKTFDLTISYGGKTVTQQITVSVDPANAAVVVTKNGGSVFYTYSLPAAFAEISGNLKDPTANFTVTVKKDQTVSSLTFPTAACAKSIELLSDGGTITYTPVSNSAVTLAPATDFTLSCPIYNSKGYGVNITAAAGKTITINSKNAVLNNITGAASSTLSTKADFTADKITTFGSVIIGGGTTLTVNTSLSSVTLLDSEIKEETAGTLYLGTGCPATITTVGTANVTLQNGTTLPKLTVTDVTGKLDLTVGSTIDNLPNGTTVMYAGSTTDFTDKVTIKNNSGNLSAFLYSTKEIKAEDPSAIRLQGSNGIQKQCPNLEIAFKIISDKNDPNAGYAIEFNTNTITASSFTLPTAAKSISFIAESTGTEIDIGAVSNVSVNYSIGFFDIALKTKASSFALTGKQNVDLWNFSCSAPTTVTAGTASSGKEYRLTLRGNISGVTAVNGTTSTILVSAPYGSVTTEHEVATVKNFNKVLIDKECTLKVTGTASGIGELTGEGTLYLGTGCPATIATVGTANVTLQNGTTLPKLTVTNVTGKLDLTVGSTDTNLENGKVVMYAGGTTDFTDKVTIKNNSGNLSAFLYSSTKEIKAEDPSAITLDKNGVLLKKCPNLEIVFKAINDENDKTADYDILFNTNTITASSFTLPTAAYSITFRGESTGTELDIGAVSNVSVNYTIGFFDIALKTKASSFALTGKQNVDLRNFSCSAPTTVTAGTASSGKEYRLTLSGTISGVTAVNGTTSTILYSTSYGAVMAEHEVATVKNFNKVSIGNNCTLKVTGTASGIGELTGHFVLADKNATASITKAKNANIDLAYGTDSKGNPVISALTISEAEKLNVNVIDGSGNLPKLVNGQKIMTAGSTNLNCKNITIGNKNTEDKYLSAYLYGTNVKAENGSALTLSCDVTAINDDIGGDYPNFELIFSEINKKKNSTANYTITLNQDITAASFTLPTSANASSLTIVGNENEKTLDLKAASALSPTCEFTFKDVKVKTTASTFTITGSKDVTLNNFSCVRTVNGEEQDLDTAVTANSGTLTISGNKAQKFTSLKGTAKTNLYVETNVEATTLQTFDNVKCKKTLTVTSALSGVNEFKCPYDGNLVLEPAASAVITYVDGGNITLKTGTDPKTGKEIMSKLTVSSILSSLSLTVDNEDKKLPSGITVMTAGSANINLNKIYIMNKSSTGQDLNAYLYNKEIKAEYGGALTLKCENDDIIQELYGGGYPNFETAFERITTANDPAAEYTITLNEDIDAAKFTLPASGKAASLTIKGKTGSETLRLTNISSLAPAYNFTLQDVNIETTAASFAVNGTKDVTLSGISCNKSLSAKAGANSTLSVSGITDTLTSLGGAATTTLNVDSDITADTVTTFKEVNIASGKKLAVNKSLTGVDTLSGGTLSLAAATAAATVKNVSSATALLTTDTDTRGNPLISKLTVTDVTGTLTLNVDNGRSIASGTAVMTAGGTTFPTNNVKVTNKTSSDQELKIFRYSNVLKAEYGEAVLLNGVGYPNFEKAFEAINNDAAKKATDYTLTVTTAVSSEKFTLPQTAGSLKITGGGGDNLTYPRINLGSTSALSPAYPFTLHNLTVETTAASFAVNGSKDVTVTDVCCDKPISLKAGTDSTLTVSGLNAVVKSLSGTRNTKLKVESSPHVETVSTFASVETGSNTLYVKNSMSAVTEFNGNLWLYAPASAAITNIGKASVTLTTGKNSANKDIISGLTVTNIPEDDGSLTLTVKNAVDDNATPGLASGTAVMTAGGTTFPTGKVTVTNKLDTDSTKSLSLYLYSKTLKAEYGGALTLECDNNTEIQKNIGGGYPNFELVFNAINGAKNKDAKYTVTMNENSAPAKFTLPTTANSLTIKSSGSAKTLSLTNITSLAPAYNFTLQNVNIETTAASLAVNGTKDVTLSGISCNKPLSAKAGANSTLSVNGITATVTSLGGTATTTLNVDSDITADSVATFGNVNIAGSKMLTVNKTLSGVTELSGGTLLLAAATATAAVTKITSAAVTLTKGKDSRNNDIISKFTLSDVTGEAADSLKVSLRDGDSGVLIDIPEGTVIMTAGSTALHTERIKILKADGTEDTSFGTYIYGTSVKAESNEALTLFIETVPNLYSGIGKFPNFETAFNKINALNDSTGNYIIDVNKDIANVPKFVLPTKAASLTVKSKAKTVKLTNISSLAPAYNFTLKDVNIETTAASFAVNGTKDVTLSGISCNKPLSAKAGAKSALTVSNITFDGEATITSLGGANTTTLNVRSDITADSVTTFGNVNIDDGKTLTVNKSLTGVDTLSGGTLSLGKETAAATVKNISSATALLTTGTDTRGNSLISKLTVTNVTGTLTLTVDDGSNLATGTPIMTAGGTTDFTGNITITNTVDGEKPLKAFLYSREIKAEYENALTLSSGSETKNYPNFEKAFAAINDSGKDYYICVNVDIEAPKFNLPTKAKTLRISGNTDNSVKETVSLNIASISPAYHFKFDNIAINTTAASFAVNGSKETYLDKISCNKPLSAKAGANSVLTVSGIDANTKISSLSGTATTTLRVYSDITADSVTTFKDVNISKNCTLTVNNSLSGVTELSGVNEYSDGNSLPYGALRLAKTTTTATIKNIYKATVTLTKGKDNRGNDIISKFTLSDVTGEAADALKISIADTDNNTVQIAAGDTIFTAGSTAIHTERIKLIGAADNIGAYLNGTSVKAKDGSDLTLYKSAVIIGNFPDFETAFNRINALADSTADYTVVVNKNIEVTKFVLPTKAKSLTIKGFEDSDAQGGGDLLEKISFSLSSIAPTYDFTLKDIAISTTASSFTVSGSKNVTLDRIGILNSNYSNNDNDDYSRYVPLNAKAGTGSTLTVSDISSTVASLSGSSTTTLYVDYDLRAKSIQTFEKVIVSDGKMLTIDDVDDKYKNNTINVTELVLNEEAYLFIGKGVKATFKNITISDPNGCFIGFNKDASPITVTGTITGFPIVYIVDADADEMIGKQVFTSTSKDFDPSVIGVYLNEEDFEKYPFGFVISKLGTSAYTIEEACMTLDTENLFGYFARFSDIKTVIENINKKEMIYTVTLLKDYDNKGALTLPAAGKYNTIIIKSDNSLTAYTFSFTGNLTLTGDLKLKDIKLDSLNSSNRSAAYTVSGGAYGLYMYGGADLGLGSLTSTDLVLSGSNTVSEAINVKGIHIDTDSVLTHRLGADFKVTRDGITNAGMGKVKFTLKFVDNDGNNTLPTSSTAIMSSFVGNIEDTVTVGVYSPDKTYDVIIRSGKMYAAITEYRALLIGQENFTNTDQCKRNRGDVELMRNMLNSNSTPMGTSYIITEKYDVTKSQLTSAISTAFKDATEDDVSLFFIATHGVAQKNAGNYAGALLMHDESKYKLSDLAAELSKVNGQVIVILESCGSGSAIYANGEKGASEDELDEAFNEAVIEAFAAAEAAIPVKNTGEFRKPKFLVLTASQHEESSWGAESSSYTNSYNYFTKWLVEGVGTGTSSPADTNNDKTVTLNELYKYIQKVGDNYAFNDAYYQHVQAYPTTGTAAYSPLFYKKSA